MYLLAFILPLTFLYSPKVEKSNIVMVTKPLTITQERNTPAYGLFQQSQIIQKNMQTAKQQQLREMASLNPVVQLSTETTVEVTTLASVAEIKIDKAELHAEADRQIQALVNKQPQSSVTPGFTQMSEGAVIRGQFELKDGVGIVDHLVVLKRVFEGQSIEVGQVDLRAGLYQIAVGAFEGEIVAEIKDRTGILIGEDRQRIYNLKRSGTFFEGPVLRLGRPAAFALNGRSVDSRKIIDKNLQASFFSGHFDLKKTTDVYPNVARHSSTLSFIKDTTNSIASTISVRSAADKSDTVLFSRKWVEGAVDYLSEQLQIQYLPETGIIIGRILVDGKPVQGAQVMIENQPGLEPYYLDQFLIPQQSQNFSSDNGYFIIPGLNEGVYEITAYIGDRRLGTQQFLVATDTVSYQEIFSSALPTSVIARSFDAFTGEPIMTELFVPGQADIINLETDFVRYRHNAQYGLTEVVNRPLIRDYAAYVYIQNQSKDHLHLPQIKEAFMEYVQAQAQVPIERDTAMFVGFTPSNFFDVHIADEGFNPAHLVFFDQAGNIVPKQTAGGGFVAFNLKEGIQEVILQDQKTERSFSTVFYSRPSVLLVSHFAE
jgi:hypothetical protein